MRRLEGSRVWHFCENCPHWPTDDYDESGGVRKPFCGICVRLYCQGGCAEEPGLHFLAYDHDIIAAYDRIKARQS